MKIGLVINHAEDPQTGDVPSYNDMRALALTAESAGLDSIWLFDHLIYRFEGQTRGIWESWTLLCALAAATQRVELGTIVLCNPFRSPALLAKMAHTLDEISAGRLILGLGAGWHEPEFRAFGFPFDNRVGRLAEALQIISPLLRGESVTFHGDYYQVEDCLITPAGPRPGGIPLMVAAFGPRMMRLTAAYAGLWNTAWLGPAAELPARTAEMAEACAAVGRDPATLAVTVGLDVHFPDLGPTNPYSEHSLSGTAAEIAAAFHAYEQAGAAHLITHLTPAAPTAIERLAAAAQLYRGS